jgi:crossover junction endodeoxyribonuclease RusA
VRFEFVIDGPPVSQQARRRENLRAWQAKVRHEAEKNWPLEQSPTSGLVMLQIIYFYKVRMDVDNIAKPIQDALKGLVYIDDDQVIDILVSKRDLSESLRIDHRVAILTEGFARGNDFLYIAVISASEKEIPILW